MQPHPTPTAVAARSLAVLSVTLVVLFASGALSPVELLAPGQRGAGGEVMVDDFGAARVPDERAYDGQAVYLIARYFPDVDRPIDLFGDEARFRMGRVLLPVLASPGGTGSTVVALMIFWNLVGIGSLTWAVADLGVRHGRTPTIGYAAAACAVPGGLVFQTNEALAFGLAMAGLALSDRGHLWWAGALFSLAVLSRETAVTFVIVIALVLVWQRRSLRPALLLASGLPALAWTVWLRTAAPDGDPPIQALGILELPERRLVHILATVVVLALTALSIVAWRDVPLVGAVASAFALWWIVYEPFTFTIEALPRVAMPSTALGAAAVVQWWSVRFGSVGRAPG